MFLQIHTLTSYPASLLNRDDAGLAKRIPFGNAIRLRVSSQCLKRHWRKALVSHDGEIAHFAGIPDGYRSRRVFDHIREKLVKDGLSENIATSLAQCIRSLALKKAEKQNSKPDDSDGSEPTQAFYVSHPEIEFLIKIARSIPDIEPDIGKALKLAQPVGKGDKLAKEKGLFQSRLGLTEANLTALEKSAKGFTAALFGRMVTSDLLARVDAPVHAAHAFTVHASNTEMDYFTVVDDLNPNDETDAAHIDQTELGAGIFYGYVVVNVPLLVSNLTGCSQKDWRGQDPNLVRKVLERLIDVILCKSPGAKLGSTAPYAYADFLMLEAGTVQPRSLANAFLNAVKLNDARNDPRHVAVQRLAEYFSRLNEMYGPGKDDGGAPTLSTVLDVPPGLPPKQPVQQAVQATLDRIFAS